MDLFISTVDDTEDNMPIAIFMHPKKYTELLAKTDLRCWNSPDTIVETYQCPNCGHKRGYMTTCVKNGMLKKEWFCYNCGKYSSKEDLDRIVPITHFSENDEVDH